VWDLAERAFPSVDEVPLEVVRGVRIDKSTR
jgi:hypothetical protein